MDGKLGAAQTGLVLQEETIRRNERDRKQMAERISALERALAAGDSEKRQLEVGYTNDSCQNLLM